jgi:hypothetical protein
MHALRTGKSTFRVAIIIAISVAVRILDATAQTGASETLTPPANEIKSLKKAGPPHVSSKLGIVADFRNYTQMVAANEVAALIATGQETGPHSEAALRVVPMVGSGGFQNIRDVLTLADADMSIVPVPLLDRAVVALGSDDLRERIVYIAPLFEEEFHLLTNLSIRNIKQLAGKTVNLGVTNSAEDVLGREVFDRFGLDINVINLDHIDALAAIKKGEIAADLLLADKPLNLLAKFNYEDGFRLIEIPRLHVLDKYFLPVTLTPDDYPNLIVPGTHVDTIGARSVLIAYNWPKGSDRYQLMDFFVRTLFSRFSELPSGPNHPKWRDVPLATSLPGWKQFAPAKRWLDQREFESFLSERGIETPADQTRLLQDLLRSRK